jgi:hypothetical protein
VRAWIDTIGACPQESNLAADGLSHKAGVVKLESREKEQGTRYAGIERLGDSPGYDLSCLHVLEGTTGGDGGGPGPLEIEAA